MRYFNRMLLGGLLSLSAAGTFAADSLSDWRNVQKVCDYEWNYEQSGHHQHIGKAVCSCMADALTQYKQSHPGNTENDSNYELFYKQASQICTAEGVFVNSASRAIYFGVYDTPSIENICMTSWIGLMGAFHPTDPKFNSSTLCHCASSKITDLVNQFDTLPPKDLRLKSLDIVKQCDPTANLNLEAFKNLSQSTPTPQAAIAPSDKGKFSLEIKDDPKPEYNAIAQYLRKDGRLQDIVSAMNQTIKIPYDIHIIVKNTDQGPYYSHLDKSIYLDYKMMQLQLDLYDKNHPKEAKDNRRHYFNNVTRFFLYHELGHALIDAYHLPVLGQEEDAADALSAVISLKYLPKGYQVLVDAADFFYLLDNMLGTDASDYWDEHSLNKQRYYRLICYAYGKSPSLVEQKAEHYYKSGLNAFIQERADYCHYGYNEIYFSWMLLLEPYLKPAPAAVIKVKPAAS